MLKRLSISLVIGLIAGLVVSLYFYGLNFINSKMLNDLTQSFPNFNYHIFLLPVVFLFLTFLKKRSLFFPTRVIQVRNADNVTYKYWSPLSAIYNLLGSWLSHLAGGSLGREGTAVVITSSLIQLLRFDFNYWRPIVMSATFGTVVGYPWIAVVFMFEMFERTTAEQKLFSILSAWVGVLLTTTLRLPHLYDVQKIIVNPEWGFFSYLIPILILAVILGISGRIYKVTYKYLMSVFSKQWIYGLMIAIGVGYFINQNIFFNVQGLSLFMLENHFSGILNHHDVISKIIFTVLCVSLGLIGGEFVPALVIGSGLGLWVGQSYSIEPQYELLVLGLYGFFSVLTRLKWTCLLLGVAIYPTWSFFVAGYVCYSLANALSGDDSVYKKFI